MPFLVVIAGIDGARSAIVRKPPSLSKNDDLQILPSYDLSENNIDNQTVSTSSHILALFGWRQVGHGAIKGCAKLPLLIHIIGGTLPVNFVSKKSISIVIWFECWIRRSSLTCQFPTSRLCLTSHLEMPSTGLTPGLQYLNKQRY